MDSVHTNTAGFAGSNGVDSSAGYTPADAAHEARLINQIVVSMLDNIDEYRRAIFGLEQLLGTLQCRLYNRVQTLEQLQAHVGCLGAQPVTTRSALGVAFASLLSTPQIFSRTHQEDLMLDVDRGERAMKTLFKQSLADKRLSTAGRECINKAIEQLAVERCRPADLWTSHGITAPHALTQTMSPALVAAN